jgi:hypothetical protein
MNAQISKVTKNTHHTENFIIHVHIKPEACTCFWFYMHMYNVWKTLQTF